MFLLLALIQIAVAHWLVDLLTGIYHYTTDKGFNFPQQVRLFNDHHDTNTMTNVVDLQTAIAAAPLAVLALLASIGGLPALAWATPFLWAFAAFTLLAQTPHYFAHHPPKNAVLRFMQRIGLMLPPQSHADHHNGTFDRNFCIFSGAHNWWMNRLIEATEDLGTSRGSER